MRDEIPFHAGQHSVPNQNADRFPTESCPASNGIASRFQWNHWPTSTGIRTKTAGIFHQLAEALAPLSKAIEFAFVYGSFARGEERSESDIDLMVVGQVTLDQLLERLTPLERTLGRPVNPTVYSSEEMRAKLKAGNHFLKAIQKGKNTFLIGDEHEFRKLL